MCLYSFDKAHDVKCDNDQRHKGERQKHIQLLTLRVSLSLLLLLEHIIVDRLRNAPSATGNNFSHVLHELTIADRFLTSARSNRSVRDLMTMPV